MHTRLAFTSKDLEAGQLMPKVTQGSASACLGCQLAVRLVTKKLITERAFGGIGGTGLLDLPQGAGAVQNSGKTVGVIPTLERPF